MKYTGRIVMLLILIVNWLIWTTIHNMIHDKLLIIDIFAAFIYIPFSWWIGWQYDKARFHSETDALTGVHNRRFVHNVFTKLLSLAERNHKCIAVLLVDINNFKTINDQYGHKKGDLVLLKISQLLVKCTRKTDIVSRWGGDEFLILAPYSDMSGIESLVHRVHEGLNELSEDIKTKISVSIGSSVYPNDANDLEELLSIADEHMYRIKLLNKNDNA